MCCRLHNYVCGSIVLDYPLCHSRDKLFQTLSRFLYCKQPKAGWGLWTQLGWDIDNIYEGYILYMVETWLLFSTMRLWHVCIINVKLGAGILGKINGYNWPRHRHTDWSLIICCDSGAHMRDDAHGFSPEDLKNIDEVTTALRDLVSIYLVLALSLN